MNHTRRKIEKLVEKAKSEIADLERSLAEKKAYILGLEEALKHMPEENVVRQNPALALRPGSTTYKVYQLLKSKGTPLHVSKILSALGKDASKKERASLVGTLGAYVRTNKIFTKPEPNTFGLLDFPIQSSSDVEDIFGDLDQSEDEASNELSF